MHITADSNPDVGLAAMAPRLTPRGLTLMLVVMCTIPVIIIVVLQLTMPPVRPGYLTAKISTRNVPPPSYYATIEDSPDEFPDAALIVTNTMDVPWRHPNIRLNHGNYQVYDHEPIEPGETRSFMLDRFVHRSGAVFQVGIVPLKHVEIYAALPDRSRATMEFDFPGH